MPVGTQYGDTSLQEDVMQIIAQITPDETPFYDMIGDNSANSPHHEWQERDLTTRSDNATQEGAAYTFAAPNPPTRVRNLTQIVRKDVRISGTSQATSRHAIEDYASDQTEVRMTEFKTDIEHALIRGSQASGNASAIARRMNGLIAAISTNATAAASGISLTENQLNGFLQDIWNAGGKPGNILVNGRLKRLISGFTGGSTKNFESSDRKVINTVNIYESDFGIQTIDLSRDVPQGTNDNTLLVFDKTMLSKAWLRTPFTERAPKVADSIDIVILGEVTLEFANEASNGKYTAIAA